MCTDVNRCSTMVWKVFHIISTLLAIVLLAGGIYMVCNPVAGCPGCGATDDYCCVSSTAVSRLLLQRHVVLGFRRWQ
jgi:hypothetical protein